MPRAYSILIVDDDEDILLSAKMVLKRHFSSVATENNPHKLEQLLQASPISLVLLDMNFTSGFTSGKEGLRWLKKIKKISPETQVILMTAFGDVQLAVRGMKEGAADFILKPWENDQLIQIIKQIKGDNPSPTSRAAASRTSASTSTKTEIIGKNSQMQGLFSIIQKVAPTDANVLILGENGTGKELFARRIHEESNRSSAPFIQVDLGALAENLFESELFGHVKGAFTDAREDRKGRFEAAEGGTLFLDEIGNLSLPLQAKLLTALQSRTINRVGSNKVLRVDIRLICATNKNIQEMVKEGSFRQDLLYRINTVPLTLPALRERVSDLPELIKFFAKRYADKYQTAAITPGPTVLKQLESYNWPGNVRELQHMVERATIMGIDSLLQFSPTEEASSPAVSDSLNLEDREKQAILQALKKYSGNISKAAKELGLGRTTLYRKMDKYGL
ncbi:MAG: sigma-54 dependent transcriptional regulator [Bacteroidota bacterium]